MTACNKCSVIERDSERDSYMAASRPITNPHSKASRTYHGISRGAHLAPKTPFRGFGGRERDSRRSHLEAHDA